jgi:hypothetical protein
MPIWRRWLRTVEDEARHLHELEVEGASPVTPAITIAEVLLVLVPVFIVLVSLGFLAYYFVA